MCSFAQATALNCSWVSHGPCPYQTASIPKAGCESGWPSPNLLRYSLYVTWGNFNFSFLTFFFLKKTVVYLLCCIRFRCTAVIYRHRYTYTCRCICITEYSYMYSSSDYFSSQVDTRYCTPVFLPGEFQGQRSLMGYSPWGGKESETTERKIGNSLFY